ncbi:MAG: (deoxy)nucleoside triphosphate pyrophosphohydrolase [Thermoplasmata archaeon]|nr:(deoxy)nucleoside triphosphate pyrophosphohydrolase [Thermoplasmata archaeon]
MELGETVCLPIAPRCAQCPVATGCAARARLKDPGDLPRRPPRHRPPHVVASVVAVEHGGRWLVQQRAPSGLLGGLWEFPGGKVAPGESPVVAAGRELAEETGLRGIPLASVGQVQHSYSHFRVTIHVFRGHLPGRRRPSAGATVRWLTPREFARLPRPKATVKAVALLRAADPAGPSPD